MLLCPKRMQVRQTPLDRPTPVGRPLRLVVVMLWALAGCKDDPKAKIKGWPPLDRQALADPFAGTEESDVSGGDLADVAVTADTTVEPVDTTPPPPPPRSPCQRMVDRACEFFGLHSDGCSMAQSRELLSDGEEAQRRCAQLISDFAMENTRHKGNPCSRFASELCRTRGHGSTDCRHARENSVKHRREYQRRACLGDLMMLRGDALFKPL